MLPRRRNCRTDVLAGTTSRPGFTLIELLVVMAIIVLVASFVVPAAGPLLKGTQLTQSGQDLGDLLAFARQRALARNRPIEVRFYRFGDPEVPGEKVADPATGKYRAMQFFEVISQGATVKYQPVDKIRALQPSIIMDSGAALSTLLDPAQSQRTEVLGSTLNPPLLLPRVGSSYKFMKFQFRPDGSTDLPLTNSSTSPGTSKALLWFLTLHSMNNGDALQAPPPNFFTVQINPANGKLRTFRP